LSIDYVIDYVCEPKRQLSTMGILARLKARERATRVIRLFRDNGDMRPPSEMGFEMARNTPQGEEEVQVVNVQTMLDESAQLDPLTHHCAGCPANHTGQPFGCYGVVNYPINKAGELWLLKQLPIAEEPLIFLLLRNVVSENRELAEQAASIRATTSTIFETDETFGRVVEGITATTNHLFGLLFLLDSISPTYGTMLLLFFGGIRRDLEADELQTLHPAPPNVRERFPFRLTADAADDDTTAALKEFLHAVYIAWTLNVTVSLDA
jgi:hypothetical protein